MSNTATSFVCGGKFYPREHFPYGIAASGEFSIQQAELLEQYGRAYQALDLGAREPVNQEEEEFLAVCKGEKAPATIHEKAWMRYREKAKPQNLFTAFGPSGHVHTAESSALDADSFDQL